MALRPGQTVENFEMNAYFPATGLVDTISLASLKEAGKWTVLVFYPADFTFVCPTELTDVANHYEEIKGLGAELIAISTDTQFSHKAWVDTEKLLENVKYPMGADPTGKVSKQFGVYDDGSGLALRGTFIIDPDGVLRSSEVNFYNVGRNADELVRKLKAFEFVREHSDSVCPAKWDDGAKILKPGIGMAGKVYEALND